MLQPVFKISNAKMPKHKIQQAQKIVEQYFSEGFFPIQMRYIKEVDNFFYSKSGKKLVEKLEKFEGSKIPYEVFEIKNSEINLYNPTIGMKKLLINLKNGVKREGIESQVLEIVDILQQSNVAEKFQPIVDDFTTLMKNSFQKSFDILSPKSPPVKVFKFDIKEFFESIPKILKAK